MNGLNFLKLSELIENNGYISKDGYYTIWFFSGSAHIYAQHILYRKKDYAIAVEHCYPGKFGI